MNRETKSSDAQNQNDAAPQKTPSTDMQPEDAGRAESGNTARGNAAETAMKQTSKTDAERGGKG